MLADNAVNKRVLAQGAVIARAIAPDSVTAAAIAPGSVYGGALAGESIHVTPIADHDAVAENGTWTPSSTETTLCAARAKRCSGPASPSSKAATMKSAS